MSKNISQKDSVSTVDKILKTAAEIIVRTGQREIPILKLAEESGVSRASIHNLFKSEDESEKAVNLIYFRIINDFMFNAHAKIKEYLESWPAASPAERLFIVFRATMASFKANEIYGKVVLQQLNLNVEDEKKLATEIFGWVDQIIDQAKKEGEVAEWAGELDSWKIRQVLFVLTRGLLRSLYLDEGKPDGKPRLTENELVIEVLRVLQLYCSTGASEKIQRVVDAMASG